MLIFRWLVVLLTLIALPVGAVPVASVTSPDGRLRVAVTLDGDGRASYAVSRGGVAVITESRLGFLFADGPKFERNLTAAGYATRSADTTWEQPWGERHQYVLPAGSQQAKLMRFDLDKRFHVSPFMPMEMQYHWCFNAPSGRLVVHMQNYREQRFVFDATLTMRREPISTGALIRALLEFPLMTVKVVTAIHFQALRLLLKRTPFHAHPRAT